MTYRNRKLLNLAKLVPFCMCCGRHNDGSIVASHSNQSRHGKGIGKKASDAAIAFCCDACHYLIDEGPQKREEKVRIWQEAHSRTMIWLIESGNLSVNKNKTA